MKKSFSERNINGYEQHIRHLTPIYRVQFKRWAFLRRSNYAVCRDSQGNAAAV